MCERFAQARVTRLLSTLVRQIKVHARNGLVYTTTRSWTRSRMAHQIDDLRYLKRCGNRDLIQAAADDVAECLTGMFGRLDGCTVTSIPSGHSQRPDSLARKVAEATAEQLGLRYRSVWHDRPIKGSSHPRAAFAREQLRWQAWPAGRVIVIDDVATSGSHMEEALIALRTAGFPAVGVAWIGGMTNSETLIADDVPPMSTKSPYQLELFGRQKSFLHDAQAAYEDW